MDFNNQLLGEATFGRRCWSLPLYPNSAEGSPSDLKIQALFGGPWTQKKGDLLFYAFGDGNAVHGNEFCQLCQSKDVSDFLAEFGAERDRRETVTAIALTMPMRSLTTTTTKRINIVCDT